MLLEDVAALIGLVFALFGVALTTSPATGVWDGIGTLAIGALLIVVAVVLVVETKSLLLGEARHRRRGRRERSRPLAGPASSG